jgi:hypothetical protein
MNNGRLNLSNHRETGDSVPGAGPNQGLPGFDYRKTTTVAEADDAIRGNMLPNALNIAYFSPANVQIVQNRLRREVYDRSNGEFLIDPQSADELMIIMRAMYLQYSKNLPTGIREQIEELNEIVADWCVPKILAECSMHKTYLHDIQNLPIPLAHPVLLTKAGSKTATLDRFF